MHHMQQQTNTEPGSAKISAIMVMITMLTATKMDNQDITSCSRQPQTVLAYSNSLLHALQRAAAAQTVTVDCWADSLAAAPAAKTRPNALLRTVQLLSMKHITSASVAA
jgi:hypothetical protein